MGRDGGRGKGKKGRGGGGGRGGGKLFVANIEELQMREDQIHEHQRKRAVRRGESDDEEEEEVVKEETTQELNTDELALAEQERAARAEARKTQTQSEEHEEEVGKTSGLLGGLEIANPNKNQNKMLKTRDLKNMGAAADEEPQLSRREREAIEAARRKAEYDRLHAAGKTDAAKADLKRLEEVRRRRAEAEKKCADEGRKPGWTENGIESDGSGDDDDDDDDEEEQKVAKPKAASAPAPQPSASELKKKAAAMEAVDTSGEIPRLSSIDIKKLNADAIKEHLKTRGLSTQGQKKDLMKRLVDYEAAR